MNKTQFARERYKDRLIKEKKQINISKKSLKKMEYKNRKTIQIKERMKKT